MSVLHMFFSSFLMALRELRRNVLRSLLTALGIIIGVAAVITLVTLGEGATRKVSADIAQMGVNMLTISPGAFRRGPTSVTAPPLKWEDARAIEREISTVRAVAPSLTQASLIVYANKNWNSTVTGITNEYLDVRSMQLEAGRAFSDVEQQGGTPVCLIGQTVRRELFGGADPLGEIVRVQKLSCTVIGIIAAKGQSAFGSDQDDFVLMPLKTVQRRIAGSTDIGMIAVSALDADLTEQAQQQIQLLLRERRRIRPGQLDDFTVQDMKQIAETMQSVTGSLTLLLSAVAAVSLLVGGIGIMNIMLVSVTERTREIGTRLAIGARGREVLLQFVVEAAVLSTLGGLTGIFLGLTGSYFGAQALGMPFVFLPNIVLIAFLFSAFVGIGFGYLPAHQAARLNPIEALRHE